MSLSMARASSLAPDWRRSMPLRLMPAEFRPTWTGIWVLWRRAMSEMPLALSRLPMSSSSL
ncbi:hypothetical protein D3C78_1616480 [compost metagenome]